MLMLAWPTILSHCTLWARDAAATVVGKSSCYTPRMLEDALAFALFLLASKSSWLWEHRLHIPVVITVICILIVIL